MANQNKPQPPADTNGQAQSVDPRDELIAAQRAQLDQVLDALITTQDRLSALEAAQTGAAAVAVDQHDQTAQFDQELAALKDEFKDFPLIEVFERRALIGLDANLDIRLKGDVSIVEDPTGEKCYWKLRWFNFSKEGRGQQAQAEGYLKVRWDDLSDQEAIAAGAARVDEYVRKGDRGYEVLHKIPRKLYDYKKRRDAARQAGMLQSESGVKSYMANQVAAMAGARGGNADQAGSFVHSKTFSVSITPGKTERFTP